MGKKSKKLMRSVALAGAAYLAGKHKGAEGTAKPKSKTPIKDYFMKDYKINYKAGDRNPNAPTKNKAGTIQAKGFGGDDMMLSPKKGGYIKAVRGTMVDGRGQGKVMRTRKTNII